MAGAKDSGVTIAVVAAVASIIAAGVSVGGNYIHDHFQDTSGRLAAVREGYTKFLGDELAVTAIESNFQAATPMTSFPGHSLPNTDPGCFSCTPSTYKSELTPDGLAKLTPLQGQISDKMNTLEQDAIFLRARVSADLAKDVDAVLDMHKRNAEIIGAALPDTEFKEIAPPAVDPHIVLDADYSREVNG